MNADKIKDLLNKFGTRDLPSGAAVLVGGVLLFLVFKSGKSLSRLALFVIAIALFAGAYWWHEYK
jgi:hypothetical protein